MSINGELDSLLVVCDGIVKIGQLSKAVYCSKNVITSRISGSDKYQWVILVV